MNENYIPSLWFVPTLEHHFLTGIFGVSNQLHCLPTSANSNLWFSSENWTKRLILCKLNEKIKIFSEKIESKNWFLKVVGSSNIFLCFIRKKRVLEEKCFKKILQFLWETLFIPNFLWNSEICLLLDYVLFQKKKKKYNLEVNESKLKIVLFIERFRLLDFFFVFL